MWLAIIPAYIWIGIEIATQIALSERSHNGYFTGDAIDYGMCAAFWPLALTLKLGSIILTQYGKFIQWLAG